MRKQLLAVVLLTASAHASRGQQQIIDDGFQLLPAFSTYDRPGIVFRRDRSNKRLEVTALTGLNVLSDTLLVPNIVLNRQVKVSFFARLLRLPISGTAGATTDRTLELKLGQPTVRLLTREADVANAVRAQLRSIAWDRDSRYYIIRDAITSASVAFRLSNGLLADLGGEGPVKGAVEAKAGASWRSGSRYQITEQLASPVTVLVKLEELIPPKAGAGGTATGEVLRRPVTRALDWTEKP